MSTRGSTFMGFGIRIDIMSQAAIFAFKQLTTKALVLVSVISQVADESMKFERAMANLSRLVVMSSGTVANLEERMTELGQTIIQMSTESIFSVQQVASSLDYLMRAGFNSAESITELEKAMALATATGMDLAEASKTIVRLTNMFAYAGQDTSNIVDQLAQSEMLFAMTTEEMNTALNMAGAVAAEAGMSLAQLATSLGVLYSAGLNASTAGTVMRRALAAVLAITGPTEDAISSLGINMSWFESLLPIDRLRVLAQSITSIEAPQERLNVAFEIFGIRGVNILPVLESMMTNFDELALSIQTAEGIAQTAGDVFRDQLYTKFVMLGQEIQNNMIMLGEWVTSGVEPIIIATTILGGALILLSGSWFGNTAATVANTVASGLNYLAKMGNWAISGINIGVLHAETAAIQTQTIWQKIAFKERMKGIWATMKGIFSKIASGGVNLILAGTYGILAASIKIATRATKAFMKALGPIALILSIVAAVIMAVKEDFGGFGGMLQQFKPIFDELKVFFKVIARLVMELAKALMPLVSIVLKSLMGILKVLIMPLRMIMKIFVMLERPIAMIFKVVGFLVQAFVNLIEKTGIMNILMKAFEIVMKIIWAVIAAVVNIFILLANLIIRIINIFRKKDKKIALIEFVPMKMDEGMGAEPAPPTPETPPPGPSPPDDTVPPSGETPTPPGVTEPTGAGGEPVSRSTGGGRGGGGDTFILSVYIFPELAEFWDELEFAEGLATKLAIEMKSSRGAYL